MKDINKDEFVKVCETAVTMSEAAKQLNMNWKTFRRYAIMFDCFKANQGGKGGHKQRSSVPIQDILDNKVSYQTYKLKNRLFKEGLKENKCECCGVSDWNGQPLNCELHHKDGDESNNNLDNLVILCPNCHSQTDNFRSKNKK